jgi:hypothetical protein
MAHRLRLIEGGRKEPPVRAERAPEGARLTLVPPAAIPARNIVCVRRASAG